MVFGGGEWGFRGGVWGWMLVLVEGVGFRDLVVECLGWG